MTTLRLPGLIDPHVHLRDPGQTHKEDWASGTAAALAGGFTQVLVMPNTAPPVMDAETLTQMHAAAAAKARCDYGIYLGAGESNIAALPNLAKHTCGLKMYLNQTFGALHIDGLEGLLAHMQAWPADRPLAVHAEGQTAAAAILAAQLAERPVHICHVSRKAEIEMIRTAKERGLQVTCEVSPHHLFLTDDSAPAGQPGPPRGGRAEVRPILATEEDRRALWENLAVIDCFATDHAPHTLAEKDGAAPPPGFPGLETALGLLLLAVHAGDLEMDDIVTRMHTNPQRIFQLPVQEDTWIEVDPDLEWEVQGAAMVSRCGWTPFEGWQLRGRVTRVFLRNEIAYENGELRAAAGSGRCVHAT